MTSQISSPMVDGKTRFRASLERAKARKGPSIGQWMMFPGYTVSSSSNQVNDVDRYSSPVRSHHSERT